MATFELPKTMRGILMERNGGIEVLEYRTDLPVPVPGPGEVLIKNEFAGVNFIDTYFRTGLYPAPNPKILGQEAEGVIAAVSPTGPTFGLVPGTRVVALATRSAAYAEYVATSAAKTFALPAAPALAPGVPAAALLQGLTALTLIREAYPVRAGDTVLVHAAAGGVGLWLCQLLAASGAHVIATASTQAKLELAAAHGAEHLVDYATEDWVARVGEITGGKGVAAVYDGVGAATFDGDLEAVARKGSVVSFGNASGAVAPLNIARLGAKNVKVLRPRLHGYVETREEFVGYCAELFGLVQEGKAKVREHKRYKLEEVGKAHEDLEGRRTTGKLLLVL